ncbi:MAG: hypothetical protein ABI340_06755 [Nitrososphaera sp.]|jgi:hypothetical protein
MAVKKIVYLVFIFPIAISFIFGGYVLSDVLGQPDRQLNMMQFNFPSPSVQQGDKDIRIVNFTESYSVLNPPSFSVRVTDTSFDCGDLYLTIYDLNTSPKQVVAQNAYFSQCFVSTNSTMPINDVFTPSIKSGNYQIVAEMMDKSNQKNISVTANFKIQ